MRSNDCTTGPKYCPHCGAELDSRVEICNFCDYNLENKYHRKTLSIRIKSLVKIINDYFKNTK